MSLLDDFHKYIEERKNESHVHYDDNLGLVFYPCNNAIDEALERSMA